MNCPAPEIRRGSSRRLIACPTIFSGASTDATIAEPPCQVPVCGSAPAPASPRNRCVEWKGLAVLRRVLDGLDDVLITGAPAEIAFERMANLLFSRIGIGLEEGSRRHDHAWGAIATLETMLFPETLLHRAELTILGHALDSGKRFAVRLRGGDRATLDRLAVDVDRAGAAGAGVATH